VASRRYWLSLFSGRTWKEFLAAGANVSGFREGRGATVRRVSSGDQMLCYLTGVSRWVGVLEVISEAFHDRTPIWSDEVFPWRVNVRPVVALTPETGVPVMDLRDQLSVFQGLANPNAWTGHFRGSPVEWDPKDALVVIQAVEEAARHPVHRPVDPRKLARRPKAVRSRLGPVTLPERQEEALAAAAEATGGGPASGAPPTEHTEIQWRLLTLGAAMGYDVWVARNDRSRTWQGDVLSELPRVQERLPRQFDDSTAKIIKLIDVLWLERSAVVAAFEIERTTSIHSGLLRMADLIALQPNLTMRMYVVAPDARRGEVMAEVGRPVFRELTPPLDQVVRYLSFSSLRESMDHAGSLLRHLKVSFLDEISESCVAEEP
jgi:hypothetical protein